MNRERFEKNMAVFSFKQHQDILTYLIRLKATGWTIEDAEEYVKIKKEEMSQAGKKQVKIPTIQCPLCPAIMFLYPVNINPSTQTGDTKDNSVWLCQSKNCMHTIYNTQTVEEISSKKR